MKFPPIAIWVALFAVLACAAEGRGFGSIYCAEAAVNVCETQASIAAFSMETAPSSSLACDFQRTLGTMASDDASAPDWEMSTLLVTVDPSRVPNPSPARAAIVIWGLQSPSLMLDSARQPLASDSPDRWDPSPGMRLSFCLAPHAPPLRA